jgi:hypothetical protein
VWLVSSVCAGSDIACLPPSPTRGRRAARGTIAGAASEPLTSGWWLPAHPAAAGGGSRTCGTGHRHALAEPEDALHHHLVAGRELARNGDGTAPPGDDLHGGAVDLVAVELPDERSLAIPLDGERRHRGPILAGDVEIGGDGHAGLEVGRLVGQRRLDPHHAGRRVDAVVDRADRAGERDAGDGGGGGDDLLALPDAADDALRHIEGDDHRRHVGDRPIAA